MLYYGWRRDAAFTGHPRRVTGEHAWRCVRAKLGVRPSCAGPVWLSAGRARQYDVVVGQGREELLAGVPHCIEVVAIHHCQA